MQIKVEREETMDLFLEGLWWINIEEIGGLKVFVEFVEKLNIEDLL